MIIYKITNNINGKVYIGQTSKSLHKRMSYHKRCAFNYNLEYTLYKAFRKYGIDNFTWETLCECSDINEMNEKEIHFIEQYKSFGQQGYNMTSGGEGMIGYHHTDETKDKLRESMKGRHGGENNPMFGMSGDKSPSYGRTGDKSVWYGKHHTDKTKDKISESNKGKIRSDETKKKISESHKGLQSGDNHPLYGTTGGFYGKKHSNETKKKLSEINSKILYKIISPDGYVEIINNLTQYCLLYNLDISNMVKVARGKLGSYKKYKCEYYNEVTNE